MPKTLITILGEYEDHPIFRYDRYALSHAVNDHIRRVDIEVEAHGFCLVVDSDDYYHCVEPPEIARQVFHSCGGIFDLEKVKLHLQATARSEVQRAKEQYEALRWRYLDGKLWYQDGKIEDEEDLYTEQRRIVRESNLTMQKLFVAVKEISCTHCKKTIDVSDVFYDDSGIGEVAKALGATGTRKIIGFSIGNSDRQYYSMDMHLHSPKRYANLSASLLDEIYYGRINELHLFEEMLEQLFPNVPGSVMEQMLREIVEKTDATISSLEKEVTLDSFGSSFSDAVGRFSLKYKDLDRKYIIKVINSQETAEKEIFIAKVARTKFPLQLYVPEIFGEDPISYKGYSLLVMEDVSARGLPHDEHKEKAYRALAINVERISEQLLHRLYVASLFHTHLEEFNENSLLFAMNVPQYEDPEELVQRLSINLGLQRTREIIAINMYTDVVSYLKANASDTKHIVHNDMRHSNWVGRNIVDFGSCTRADKGGGIYRDIVRILLAENNPRIFDAGYVQKVVDIYYAFRNFEEQKKRESRDMGREYAQTFAELYVEAPRHMLITYLHHKTAHWEREIEWYNAVHAFAEKEIKRR